MTKRRTFVARSLGVSSLLLIVAAAGCCRGKVLRSDNDDNIYNDKNGTTAVPVKRIGVDAHGLPVLLPLVGAGTWRYDDAEAYQSLCKAFGAGVSFVDTASGYRNQKGVGRAIRDCYFNEKMGRRRSASPGERGVVGEDDSDDRQQGQLRRRRSDLFVMTKIPGGLTHQETLAMHHQNMFELNLEYVDHLMAHYPSDWDQRNASKQLRQEEWLALEEIYDSGKARSIGVSHYCPRHLQDILEVATVMPSINQVEYHVGSSDVDGVMEFCKQHNITFMSFSPLCGPCQYDPADSLVDGELVSDIARRQKGNVTGAQVSLRFIVQQALQEGSYIGGVIPKSSNIDHIRANMDLFSFELSDDDMERLRRATQPAAEKGDCDVP